MENVSPKIEDPQIRFIEERRLVGTMLSTTPHSWSAIVSAFIAFAVILTTLVYWMLPLDKSNLLTASYNSVFVNGQWWRLLSAVFIHSDPAHLLSNLLLLSIFGFFVYGYFGLRIFPLMAVLIAAIVNGLTVASYDSEMVLLGASGLVYVLGAFWLTLYFFIQRQYRITSRLIRVVGISLMLFAPSTFVPTTSYTAHAIGFLLGVLSGGIYFYLNFKKIRSHEVFESTWMAS